MPAEVGVSRGCGATREEGGLYLEVGLSEHGRPFDSFLLDPLVALHPDDLLAIPRLGQTLIDGPDGITHVIDWVGEAHYPYATDFLEEGRRKGFSRKISRELQIGRLDPGKSFIYFLHARGFLANWPLYQAATVSAANIYRCREESLRRALSRDRGTNPHLMPDCTVHCCRHLWSAAPVDDGALRRRIFTDFDYDVSPPYDQVIYPDWKAAYVARFPITNFTVIRSRDGAHEQTTRRARARSRYPVLEADA
jgi:hypothetical protein